MKKMLNKYINNEHDFDKLTMLGIFCLMMVISGIFGWSYEVIFYYFNGGMKDIYFRGGNFLPWINIYAYGALLIYFFTYKKRESPLKVFLFSLLVCGIFEFLSGWFLYGVIGLDRCWDYNKEILNFGNIGGYVCFRSAFFFGLSGLFLMYVVVPFCFFLATKLSKKTFLIISITLFSIFYIDEIYNFIIAKLLHLKRASTIYKSLGIKYFYFK